MSKMDRRSFLKKGTASIVGATAASIPGAAGALGRGPERPALAVDRVVNACCPFCQVRCTVEVMVHNGQVVNIFGRPDNYYTGGTMCPKGKTLVELHSSPDRLLYPMLREGSGFKRISYDQALDIIAEKVQGLMKQKRYENKAVMFAPLWDCRESELAALLTMRMMGFPNIMQPGDACIASSATVLNMFTGSPNSTTTIDEFMNAETVVLWGANIAETYPPLTRWITMAREKGVKFIFLDCRGTPTSNLCDIQYRPRAGSDGALVMGIIRYLIQSGQYDRNYVSTTVKNFDGLVDAVSEYTPDKVAAITGISPEDQMALADQLGRSKRTILWMGGCLSRYSNGMQTTRAIISLQGITNQLAGPGKGLINMQGGKPGGDEEVIEHLVEHLGLPEEPRPFNMRRVNKSLEKGDVELVFLNSTYRRYPACNSIREGLKKSGLVVYRGFFMNEEAEVSHLLIPGTMPFESEGSQYGAQRQVVWRSKAVEPQGETVEDWRFYRDLGMRLFPDTYPKFASAAELYEIARKAVHSWHGLKLEKLMESPTGLTWPWFDESEPEHRGNVFRDGKLLTADGMLDLDNSSMGKLRWEEPADSPIEMKTKDYPLFFTQGKVVQHWQHTFTNYAVAAGQLTSPRYVSVHPETGGQYGIADGDFVLLQSQIGELECVARLDEEILPGMVFTPSHYSSTTSVGANRGQPVNSIVPDNWDRVSAQFNGFGCRLVKKS